MKRFFALGVVALTAYGFAAMGCGGSSDSTGNGGSSDSGGSGSGGTGSGGSSSGGTSSTPTSSGGVAGGSGGSAAGGSAAGGSAAGGSAAGECSTTNGDYQENTTFGDEGKTAPYEVNKWGTWGNETVPTLTQTTEGPEGLDCSSGCALLTIDFSNGTKQYSAGQMVEYFGQASDAVENLLNQTITVKVALQVEPASGASTDVPISLNLIGQDASADPEGVADVWNHSLGTAASLAAADGWHTVTYKVVDVKAPSWAPKHMVCASALHDIGITIQNDKNIDDTNGAVVKLFVQSISVGGGSSGGSGGSGGGSGGSAGAGGTGGGGSGGGTASCDDLKDVTACGGDVVETWTVKPSCLKVSGELDVTNLGIGCTTMAITGSRQVSGKWTATADGKYKDETTTKGEEVITMDAKCLEVSGTTTTCENIGAVLQTAGYASVDCADAADGGCTCTATIDQKAGIGFVAYEPPTNGAYTIADNEITADEDRTYSYCVSGSKMEWTPKITSPTITGTILFESGSSAGGTGGAGGGAGGTTGGGGSTGSSSCANVEACGGDLLGTWNVTSSCLKVSGELDVSNLGIGCTTMGITGSREVSGKWTATSDGKYKDETTTKGEEEITMDPKCLEVSGTTTTCENIGAVIQTSGYSAIDCADAAGGGCTCTATIDQKAGIGFVAYEPPISGSYTTADNEFTADEERTYSYCVSDTEMKWTPKPASPTITGSIDFQKE
jgi:uncharacterized membrane protein YgcG